MNIGTALPTGYLPAEIWMVVASYLPRKELMSLMSVNRAFYEVAMDEKFWEVDFTKANAKKFMEMVEMIRGQRTSFRVRSLKLMPTAIWSSTFLTGPTFIAAPEHAHHPPIKHPWLPAFLRSIFIIKDHRVSHGGKEQNVSMPPPTSTPIQRGDGFVRALQGCMNVNKVEVLCPKGSSTTGKETTGEPPSLSLYKLFHALPLHNIRHLRIRMDASRLTASFVNLEPLVNLRELVLELHFPSPFLLPSLPEQRGLIADHIVPFINSAVGHYGDSLASCAVDMPTSAHRYRTCPTLGHFELVTSGHMPDLSPLFGPNGLNLGPELHSVSLKLPFDPKHIEDPMSIVFFLKRHRRIKRLVLGNQNCCFSEDGEGTQRGRWMEGLLDADRRIVERRQSGNSSEAASTSYLATPQEAGVVTYPSVTTLHVRLNFPPMMQERFYTLLAQVFPNVAELATSDMCFSFDEVKLVLAAFFRSTKAEPSCFSLPKRSNCKWRMVGRECESEVPAPPSSHFTGKIQAGGLASLSLFVRNMNPVLIALLADSCPTLKSLTLSVDGVSSINDWPVSNVVVGAGSDDSKKGLARTMDTISQWTLEDITILHWVYAIGRRYCWVCMEAVANSIPSVKSFAGQGHKGRSDEEVTLDF